VAVLLVQLIRLSDHIEGERAPAGVDEVALAATIVGHVGEQESSSRFHEYLAPEFSCVDHHLRSNRTSDLHARSEIGRRRRHLPMRRARIPASPGKIERARRWVRREEVSARHARGGAASRRRAFERAMQAGHELQRARREDVVRCAAC